MNRDQLIEDIQDLPDTLVQEVQHYVEFLKEKMERDTAEDRFWNLLDLMDWNADSDEEVLQPLVDALAVKETRVIFEFQDQLAQKLYLLDSPAYWNAFKQGTLGGSADYFLYGRCYVVANGRAFFQAVLDDPAKIVPDHDYEPLLNIPDQAFFKKTGTELKRTAAYNYESFSNEKHWISDSNIAA